MTELWRATASRENLLKRADIYAQIRQFFTVRDVLEVETPLMTSAAVSDPYIDTIACRYHPIPGQQEEARYLQSSPEYGMKRLLASGSGAIYQICKAFRNGEAGRRHNPEFTMLEWYRPGFDHLQLMDEVEALVAPILNIESCHRVSYGELFQHYLNINPHTASAAELAVLARQHIELDMEDENRDNWLNLLMSHVIEPKLAERGAVFVFDYPATQAALAKVATDSDGQAVACRFELFYAGVELANGYFELTDGEEQARRFHQDIEQRRAEGLPQRPVDNLLVDALNAGMPECAGVAMGLDRLTMLALNSIQISDVIALPFDRA
ncbi:EF-P lysine aminoacylase EpmA [Amphritea balenae]|uniref:EF-P lysine aminoacylase GenX n=1 Tax=Amphritea balenae TaxID=452629 RepID=A0A3P1SPL1_9GAMM|nr:EF-P lysine aminoacylase EpmA [Amphritea balenae]RRC98585.1 EF-P lysine aminoacylase GenX [Amphritea balenae]GGK65737.1 elongation factor P--(R)-beta-lysine ligase [Amphritea balenae]